MRPGTKDVPRNVKSADDMTMSQLIGSAADAATKKRQDSRRSPQRSVPSKIANGKMILANLCLENTCVFISSHLLDRVCVKLCERHIS